MATLSLNENNLQKNNQNNNNSLISDELIFENALPLSSKKEEDDNNWTPITGGIKNVSSSGIGYIWAVADDDRVYKCNKNCIDGNFQLPDKDIRLKQFSSDQEYVWGLDANGYVHKAPNDGSVPFIKATQFKNISASKHGGFYGVSTNYEIYLCKHIPGNLKQIDAD